MNLPLSHSLHTEKPTGDYNAGLWYDKFFSGWDDQFSKVPGGNKADWVSRSANKCGEQSVLSEQHKRLQNRVAAQGGHLLYFKTDGRFVTGMGREHPVENGFAWHHTLGVPYLPGSSLKGVLRAWAREQEVEPAVMARIFGPDDRHTVGVGSVIFFDVIPSAPVQLQADVMTPHYGPYYQDQDEPVRTPPADWYDPVPIPFLVVDDAQPFVFALAPRRINDPTDKADCEMVTGWLEGALTWLGAGAKTTVGYGRFKLDQAATKAAAEEQRHTQQAQEQQQQLAARLQGLSLLAQELVREIETRQLDTDKNAFSAPPLIEEWLKKLEVDPVTDALQQFRDLIDMHFPGLLENPDKIKGKHNNPVFNDRKRSIAKRMQILNDKKS
jgi:CRISPR-associated protein Cmr6